MNIKLLTFAVILFLFALNSIAKNISLSDCDADFEIISQELTTDGWLVQFQNLSEASGGFGDVIWDFGDGSTSSELNPEHIYNTAGEYEICLVITNADGSCNDERCESGIAIGEADADCEADWAWDDDGLLVSFSNDSDAGGSSITTYAWTFGDGGESDDENPSHTYIAGGEYDVCLSIITADGCFSSFCNDIDIEGEGSGGNCSALFSVETITSAEGGFIVSFSNETSGGVSGGATPYIWDFGDGSGFLEEESPEHTYASAGTFTVCLTVGESGTDCFDQYCGDIVLSELPVTIENMQNENISIYPNPVQDILTIDFDTPNNYVVEIMNLIGIKIFHAELNNQKTQFNMQSVPAGTYLLNIKNETETISNTIIIQH